MSKVQTIRLINFKAITDLEADFNGSTAIITGKNNSGKTSFLRGIPDRIRFIRPDVMVKQGETEGKGEMILDSGEKFVWEFNVAGKDKLTFITTEGIRQSVTKDLGSQFFPPVFDIDKFLQSPPKQQVKQLQAIVGLDFTDIDERYQKAYDLRTARNREAELFQAKLSKMLRCDPVQSVDMTDLKNKKDAERDRLNHLYQQNREHNNNLRNGWESEKEKIRKECEQHNSIQTKRRQKYNACYDALQILVAHGYSNSRPADAFLFVDNLKNEIEPDKIASELYPSEPTYIEEMPDRSELDKLDKQIEQAVETNAKAKEYQDYIDYKKQVDDAYDIAKQADEAVKTIEAERKQMIDSASFPEGITITPAGIEVDGLPLDRNQISTSKLYTSALRIASMNLGEVKTLYFDASFLDKNSLKEIQQWAEINDLQLLIERPDYDGGEIKYELIEG